MLSDTSATCGAGRPAELGTARFTRGYVAHASLAPVVRHSRVGRRSAVGSGPIRRASTSCALSWPAAFALHRGRCRRRARRGRRLLRPQCRRRRGLRRGVARPRGAGPACAGGLVARGRAELGAVRAGHGGGHRQSTSTTTAAVLGWQHDVWSNGHTSRPGRSWIPALARIDASGAGRKNAVVALGPADAPTAAVRPATPCRSTTCPPSRSRSTGCRRCRCAPRLCARSVHTSTSMPSSRSSTN